MIIKTQRLEEENKYLKSKNTETASVIEGKSSQIQKEYQQINREVVTIRE